MKKSITIAILLLLSYAIYGQISTQEELISFKSDISVLKISKKTHKILPSLDMNQIALEDKEDEENGIPPRFGFLHEVSYNLNNSGEWIKLPDGAKIWRLSIHCPEALSINLSYDKFWIPNGAKFFVYNENTKQSIGAITSDFIDGSKDNPIKFATSIIYGEDVVFEYFQPVSVKEQPIISLSRIDYGYRFVNNASKGFGDAGNCHENINCYNTSVNFWENL